MSTLTDRLGVQSYCFRHFKDNVRVAELVKEIGLDAIELCAVHVDFDDEAARHRALEIYQEADIEVLSLGVQRFRNDPRRERAWFDFAQRIGARTISADFEPATWLEAIRSAQELCDEFAINLAIHNHGGRHWLGSAQMLRHVLSVAGSRVGLCLDTAWALHAGEDPLAWVDLFHDRIFGVHLKDFVFDRAGKPSDVVVGTGNLDLPALLARLEAIDFTGYAVLEYEGDVENPVPALKQCVERVRAAGA